MVSSSSLFVVGNLEGEEQYGIHGSDSKSTIYLPFLIMVLSLCIIETLN